jgi:hypothetical protein
MCSAHFCIISGSLGSKYFRKNADIRIMPKITKGMAEYEFLLVDGIGFLQKAHSNLKNCRLKGSASELSDLI